MMTTKSKLDNAVTGQQLARRMVHGKNRVPPLVEPLETDLSLQIEGKGPDQTGIEGWPDRDCDLIEVWRGGKGHFPRLLTGMELKNKVPKANGTYIRLNKEFVWKMSGVVSGLDID